MDRLNKREITKTRIIPGARGHVIDTDYFYFGTSPLGVHDLAVVDGGHEKCAPDFDLKRSSYPTCFIIYVIRGKGTLITDSNTHHLRPDTLSGFFPGVTHHYISDPHDPLDQIFITFSGREAKALMEQSPLSDSSFLMLRNPSVTLDIFETILNIGLEKGVHAQQICCHYLKILFLRLNSDSGRSQQERSISMSTYLNCTNFIDQSFSELSSPSQVAEFLGMNVRYMANLFKRYGDVTPHEYIMRLKLNKAARLLLTSTATVKEIGRQIGFTDPYHFSRNFKKSHGYAPQRYRNNHF